MTVFGKQKHLCLLGYDTSAPDKQDEYYNNNNTNLFDKGDTKDFNHIHMDSLALL